MLEKVIAMRIDDLAFVGGQSGRGGGPGRLPLDSLPGYLDADAERLLIGVSVYREPADRNAVLFQVGVRDWTAARAPDRHGPAPPYLASAGLTGMLAVCQASGLLIAVGNSGCAAAADEWHAVYVEEWLAAELHALLAAAGRGADLTDAHRRAADYWQWRSAAWPQGRRADLHDLLEARHHMFEAGDIDQASALTEAVCAQLHAWGDLGREAALIRETLDRLPLRSAGRAGWIHELGRIAEVKGDHADAEHRYQQALDMFATAGDQAGVSRSYHSLGVLAQARGDYAGAEHRYEQAELAAERPGASARPPAGQAAQRSPAAGAIPAGPSAPAGPAALGAPATPAGPAARPAEDLDLTAVKAAAKVTAARPAMTPVTVPRPAARNITRPAAPAAPGHRLRPPLASRWRLASHWRPASHWRLAVLAAVAVGVMALPAVQISGLFAGSSPARRAASGAGPARPGTVSPGAAEAARRQTAFWVRHQVSGSAIIACDPAMCSALRARGVPAGSLVALGPGSGDPLDSNIVVATAAVRSQFGVRLAAVYAPVVAAVFGTGGARIQVRVVAPDGSAAYLGALRSDLLDRQRGGAQLLRNKQISVAGPARGQLADGLVDARLLMTLAVLVRLQPLRIVSFGAGGPGASGEVPLPAALITGSGHDRSTGRLRSLVTFLRAQRPPFLAASVRTELLADGQTALSIDFAEPGPLGLLSGGALTHYRSPTATNNSALPGQ